MIRDAKKILYYVFGWLENTGAAVLLLLQGEESSHLAEDV